MTHVGIDGDSIEVSGAFSDALRYKDWGVASPDDGAFHALFTRK